MAIRTFGASPRIRKFVRWLETEIDVRHRVDLHMTSKIYGFFDAPKESATRPTIIATDDADALGTIAHEMVHYEQWRDRRKITERGVEVRARSLVAKWKNSA